jgi:hypothetical protein
MAGNGPKAVRRCGQYADGLVTDPKAWKEHTSEFEGGRSRRREGPEPVREPLELLNGPRGVGARSRRSKTERVYARKVAFTIRFKP